MVRSSWTYSLYDAMQAGFEKVVFIINHRIEEDFYEVVGRRAEKHLEVHYVFQQRIPCSPQALPSPKAA
jgi:dTDP-glucose pyrophosphorylase